MRWPRWRSSSTTAPRSRPGTILASPGQMSPSSAAPSKPSSMAWSRPCSVPPAPSACMTPSTTLTRWPMWASWPARRRRPRSSCGLLDRARPARFMSAPEARGPEEHEGEGMPDDFRTGARLAPKGNHYEDFEPGRVFKHHWGRTITESESTLFSTLTLHFNPHYFNAAYARPHGHPAVGANPLLVFTTEFGMTVADLIDGGGPFLG